MGTNLLFFNHNNVPIVLTVNDWMVLNTIYLRGDCFKNIFIQLNCPIGLVKCI